MKGNQITRLRRKLLDVKLSAEEKDLLNLKLEGLIIRKKNNKARRLKTVESFASKYKIDDLKIARQRLSDYEKKKSRIDYNKKLSTFKRSGKLKTVWIDELNYQDNRFSFFVDDYEVKPNNVAREILAQRGRYLQISLEESDIVLTSEDVDVFQKTFTFPSSINTSTKNYSTGSGLGRQIRKISGYIMNGLRIPMGKKDLIAGEFDFKCYGKIFKYVSRIAVEIYKLKLLQTLPDWDEMFQRFGFNMKIAYNYVLKRRLRDNMERSDKKILYKAIKDHWRGFCERNPERKSKTVKKIQVFKQPFEVASKFVNKKTEDKPTKATKVLSDDQISKKKLKNKKSSERRKKRNALFKEGKFTPGSVTKQEPKVEVPLVTKEKDETQVNLYPSNKSVAKAYAHMLNQLDFDLSWSDIFDGNSVVNILTQYCEGNVQVYNEASNMARIYFDNVKKTLKKD